MEARKGTKSQKSFFLQLLTAASPSSTSNANLHLLFYAGDVFTLPLYLFITFNLFIADSISMQLANICQRSMTQMKTEN